MYSNLNLNLNLNFFKYLNQPPSSEFGVRVTLTKVNVFNLFFLGLDGANNFPIKGFSPYTVLWLCPKITGSVIETSKRCLPGVDFINSFRPYAKLSRLAPVKSLSKVGRWARKLCIGDQNHTWYRPRKRNIGDIFSLPDFTLQNSRQLWNCQMID